MLDIKSIVLALFSKWQHLFPKIIVIIFTETFLYLLLYILLNHWTYLATCFRLFPFFNQRKKRNETFNFVINNLFNHACRMVLPSDCFSINQLCRLYLFREKKSIGNNVMQKEFLSKIKYIFKDKEFPFDKNVGSAIWSLHIMLVTYLRLTCIWITPSSIYYNNCMGIVWWWEK